MQERIGQLPIETSSDVIKAKCHHSDRTVAIIYVKLSDTVRRLS